MFDFLVGTGLEEHLRASGIEKIVLAGLTSQTCIEGTGRHALEAGFPRYVPDGRRRGFHGRSASGGSRDLPPVCIENLIRVDDVMESPKLVE
jgi:hypothetical protein